MAASGNGSTRGDGRNLGELLSGAAPTGSWWAGEKEDEGFISAAETAPRTLPQANDGRPITQPWKGEAVASALWEAVVQRKETCAPFNIVFGTTGASARLLVLNPSEQLGLLLSLGEEVLLGCVLASKRADSASKRLTKLGTAGGGPARPLRRSSQ
ncbi:hypothetical protein PIB30_001061 [Stylosanthes scabra]|uniref:Uncharacterized protein n=1 Tax=Stylosanthes scabra TaxID=79078 RepID=A0ABU6U195_9FABA|nr:hypothetical protein [Stylosanthes scabra]